MLGSLGVAVAAWLRSADYWRSLHLQDAALPAAFHAAFPVGDPLQAELLVCVASHAVVLASHAVAAGNGMVRGGCAIVPAVCSTNPQLVEESLERSRRVT